MSFDLSELRSIRIVSNPERVFPECFLLGIAILITAAILPIIAPISRSHQSQRIPRWNSRGSRLWWTVIPGVAPKQWLIAPRTIFCVMSEYWPTDGGEAEIGHPARTAGIGRPWVSVLVRQLSIRIRVIRMAKTIGKVGHVVGLPPVSTTRTKPGIQRTQSHARCAGPPHFAATSRTRERTRGSRIARRVVIVRIDETVPPIPMFGQSRRDDCIVIELPSLSPSAKPKEDKEHNRSRRQSHDNEDAGDGRLVLEESGSAPVTAVRK